ncbi:ATP-binding cassette sub- A member 12 [Mactra antiquata]
MGMFGQLGALFWKNILIRRRNPMYVVLEVVWPILLFVILVLMRLGSPPFHKETCEYQARELPSAGLMPFLQTSICGLNNNCSTRDWVKDRDEAQARFQGLIQDLEPLVTKETTVEAFKSLPTVTEVLNNFKDVAGSSSVDAMDEKLLLKNMFKDSDKVVQILSNKYKILDPRLAHALMDASLNPVAFITSFGSMDFKKIVCDPNELERYIILSDKSNKYVVNKFSVSTSLCRIRDEQISDIVNELVHQIDIANVIRLGKDLADISGDIDIGLLLSDLADLVDMYMGSSHLLAMMKTLDLSAIPTALRTASQLLPLFNDMSNIDFGQLSALLDFIEPIVMSTTDNSADLEALHTLLNGSQEIFSSLESISDTESLLEQLPNLLNNGNMLNMSLYGIALPTTMVPTNDGYNFINMIMNGSLNMENLSTMSMNDSLDSMELMIRSLYDNKTIDLMMAMATNMMEMMTEYTTYIDNVEEDLLSTIVESDDVISSLNNLSNEGNDVMYAVLSEMITMDNLYGMLSGDLYINDVCKAAVNTAYNQTYNFDFETLTSNVCTPQAITAVEQVFINNDYDQLNMKLSGHMSDMDVMMTSGTVPDNQSMMDLKEMYVTMTTMMSEMTTLGTYGDWMMMLYNTSLVDDAIYTYMSLEEIYMVNTISLMPVMMVGGPGESSPMWNVMSPHVELIDAVVHVTKKKIHMFEVYDATTKIVTNTFKYLPYYPDIINSATQSNITELIVVVMQNDSTLLTDLLCNKTQWNNITMLYGESVDELKYFICNTDFTEMFWSLMEIAEPLAFVAEIESEFEKNLNSSIDWYRMTVNLQYIMDTLSGENSVDDIFLPLIENDLSWITHWLQTIPQMLTSMGTTDAAMSTNMSIADSLKGLDEGLQSWDLWKRVKHYTRTWNLMAKIMNQYAPLLNDPSWNVTSFISDMSPTLGSYLNDAADEMPEVITAVETLARRPDLLSQRLNGINYEDFCGDYSSLSLILGIDNTLELQQLQDNLCSLNWTTVMTEISDSNPDIIETVEQWDMILTYDTFSLPPITINWTDVVLTAQQFGENVNNGLFNSLIPDWSTFGVNGVNSSLTDLTALQNTWNFDVNSILVGLDQVSDLLNDMNTTDRFIKDIHFSILMNAYISNHLYKFMNLHLNIINTTKTLDLRAHMNSTQAENLLRLFQNMPELNAVLLESMPSIQDGLPAEWLKVDLMNICNDTQQLESLLKIPVNNTLTSEEVVEIVCKAVNIPQLLFELRHSLLGLDDLLSAIENIYNGQPLGDKLVDHESFGESLQEYMDLLESITMSHIQVIGLPNDEDFLTIQRQLEQFMNDFNSDFNVNDLASLNSENQTLQSLQELLMTPGMSGIVHVSETYMLVLTAMFDTSSDMLVDPATGFQNYPEMYKMWQFMDWLPQLYTVFTYTSYVDNQKITTFFEAMMSGVEELCMRDPYDLMTDPPILNISFNAIFTDFCSINITTLQDEMNMFLHIEQISSAYDALRANTTDNVTDAESWMVANQMLTKAIENFANKSVNFKLPNVYDTQLWNEIMEFLGNMTMNPDVTNIYMNSNNNFMQILSQSSPEFRLQLLYTDISYDLMEMMLDRLENSTVENLADLFYGYGEIQKLMILLQERHVLEILVYSYNTPQFTALFGDEATVAFTKLCTNLTEYISIPPDVSVNITNIQQQICDINIDRIETQFTDMLMIEQIMEKLSDNTTYIDWMEVNSRNDNISARIGLLIENPPMIDLPSDWLNETFWLQLLTLMNSQQTTTTTQVDPSMEAFLQQLQSYVGDEYSALLEAWAPIAVQIGQLTNMDMEAKRAFATVDLILEFLNDRMKQLTDNVTVENLSMNSTDITEFMEALNELRQVLTTSNSSKNDSIDAGKILELMNNPDLLRSQCDSNTAASYISINGTINNISKALEKVICLDPNMWQSVIEEQTNQQEFEQMLMEIWNTSNIDVKLNWTSVSNNVEQFITYFMNWIEMPPVLNTQLSQWANWEGTLEFLNYLSTDPYLFMSILQQVGPTLTLPDEVINLTNQLLMPLIQQLTSDHIDEEKLYTLLNIEKTLNTLSQVYTAILDDTKESRETILMDFVCGLNGNWMYLSTLMQQGLDLSFLCGLDYNAWNMTLLSRYTPDNVTLINNVFDEVIEEEYRKHMSTAFTMEEITDVMMKMNISMFIEGYYWSDWIATLSQNFGTDSYTSLLQLMEDDYSINEFKKTLLTIVDIQDHINMMLNKITGENRVPLIDILPDPEAMASFINDFSNSGSFSTLLMSSIDPIKFLNVMLSDDWNKTICNLTLFMETFYFSPEINVTSLQEDLCFNQQGYYVSEVAKSIDIRSLLMKIEGIYNNGQVNASIETWNYMEQMLATMIGNMFNLTQVDTYGMDTWSDTMLTTLNNLMQTGKPINESIEESCVQIFEGLQEIPYIYDYMTSVDRFVMISNSIMNVMIDMDRVVCETNISNTVEVLDKLKQLEVPDEMSKVVRLMSDDYHEMFTCNNIPIYVNFVETFIQSLTSTFDESSNVQQCVVSATNNAGDILYDLTRLFRTGSQMIEILQDEDIKNLLSQLMGSDVSTALLTDIIDIYNQQENAVTDLTNQLQSNMTDLASFLEQVLSRSTESIFSSLNVTYLQNAASLTPDELIQSICSSGDVASIDSDLNATLCGNDTQLAQDVANTLIEYANTLQMLENMAEYDSTSFWNKVSEDVSSLIGNIEGLTNLGDIIENLGNIDINNLSEDREILKLLQQVLVDNGPDAFLYSLNNLLETFSMINTDNTSNALIKDISMLADGVFAFSSLRSLALANVKISDLVKDTEQFKLFMINTLELPQDVSDMIIDGSLSIEMLISAAQINVTDYVCNSTKLGDIITIKNDSITNVEEISKELCNVDPDIVDSLIEEILTQLDIGEFIEESILNADKLFNISIEDTKNAVQSIVTANEDLQVMTKTLNEFAETIPEAFANLAVAQTAPQEFGSFSAILCGSQIPIIPDQFDTKTHVRKSEQLSDEQKQEFNTLPGSACKDMYLKIMEDRNGPIIWGYLKPLILGKILYTPKTSAVETIVQQINSSFSALEEFVLLAESWADGSVTLADISGDNAKELKELLNSNTLQGVITEIAGVSPNSLDDILYTLETADVNMMSGISKIADMIQSYISCVSLDRFEGFDDESSLEVRASNLADNNELLAGLVFDANNGAQSRRKRDTTDIPTHIHYKIRMDIDNVPITSRLKDRMWRPQPFDNFFTEMRYFRGFIQLQDMVDQAIISLHGNVSLSPSSTKQLPFPCHSYDTFVNVIAGYLLNVIMTLSWLAAISVAVYNLVYDRERGQEETLIAMGMRPGLNWIAWFISTLFLMAVVALIDCLLLKYGNIFTKTNFAILYLYFLDFIVSTIMLSYFVSAFFTRTSLAILATIIVYVLSYLPFVILFTLEVNTKFWHKILACLSSTTAFSYAAQYIARFEEQSTGLKWDNIHDDPLNTDGFSFSWCCIMIAIDAGIYMILGWYVRNVKKGKFGVSEPWYFIVSPSFWCGLDSKSENRYAASNQDIFKEENNDPSPIVLSAHGLSKTYSDGTEAVKNLDIDIQAGNVTTLLGHNGAAKTTTMNMMTGILTPTSGEVKMSDKKLKSMRGKLGICSQHNALYDYMTVKEHMEFYNSIKSKYCGTSDKHEIKRLLKDVDLWTHRDVTVKNLSGGMQRRLCVALAFVGGSRAVILDEPTSGVDPSGRRAIWNLITQGKKDSAVLLSSHHLDEADIVSDQIVIMHEGRSMCQGSPMFLKHHLASGHRLTVLKQDIDIDTAPIQSVVTKWIPSSTLLQTAGSEITFILPLAKESDFYGLFHDLDEQSHTLNIVSYGISDPNLEEVFMKVCKAADNGITVSPETLKQLDSKIDENKESKYNMEQSGNQSRDQVIKKGSGSKSTFSALLTKRFHHYRRDWRIIISVLILPLLLVLVASGLYELRPESSSYPNLYLSPAMYGPQSYMFVEETSSLQMGESILQSFMNAPGVSTSCMADMNLGEPYECVTPDDRFHLPVYDNTTTTGQCICDDHEYKCQGRPYGTPPPQLVTMTTDILQDVSGRDVVGYLLNSFPEFIEKRYGGWSFEDKLEGNEMKLKSTIWYNNQGYHTLPAFYNAYSNGLLRSVVKDNPESYGISTYSHPFLFSKEPLSKDTILKHAADMGIALIMLLAFTFIPVGVLMYSVNENVTKQKHMQFVSGVSAMSYWFAALIWDLFILGIAVGVSVLILMIFKPDSFWDRENLGATVTLLALYGWCTITLAYMLVKRFKSSSTAFFTMFCTLLFMGIITLLVVFSLDLLFTQYNEVIKDVHNVLQYVFLIFPPYALGAGLLDLISNQVRTEIYSRFKTDVYIDPFTFDMVGWNLFALGVEGFIFFVITIWMDSTFCCSREHIDDVKDKRNDDIDDDVRSEMKRIDSGHCREDVVIVRDIHKVYDTKKSEVRAVNGLSFGVRQGQCFGLLGINGAGKSTTFNILTGMLQSSYGSAFILNKRIEPGTSTLGDNLGYCPQEDALDPYLTVYNTLNFHVQLKKLSSDAAKQAIEKVMLKLDLYSMRNKLVKSCSGGMKRRLSLAIALLGDPAVVLLDEPTTGMDPKAKRLVWNCLQEAKQNGQAIILTSHSMEECDILCDNIGIMVNGELKCLGSSQHLKQKFGDGYTVMLYTDKTLSGTSDIHQLINTHFPSATVTDQHVNVVQLDLPKQSVKVSELFGILEQEKTDYNIVYYTVSQTTLDTIFLNFAREQTDGVKYAVEDRRQSDTDSESTPPSSSLSNPFYAGITPALNVGDNKNKGRPDSMAVVNPAYILPTKNTFSDNGSFSTRL